jgi:two-component system response regulator NreC
MEGFRVSFYPKANMRRRILIADDHEVMRKGLRMLLSARTDWQVCGEASSGQEAVEKASELEPDLVVMDVSMPQMDGMEATRCILKNRPQQKIVMYTMHESAAFTCAAIRAGAQGAVRKSGRADQLYKAIEAVLQGDQFFPAIGLAAN